MFVTVGNDLVNLKNISNINIDKKRNRIVFNFGYSVKMNDSSENKLISDYYYWDCKDFDDVQRKIQYLKIFPDFKKMFIETPRGFVNRDHISTVRFLPERRRVIINFSNQITHKNKKNEQIMIPEFLYINFDTENEYLDFVSSFKRQLRIFFR